MLANDKRLRLNSIVDQATKNGESEQNIQEIVNQFKSKYDQPETAPTQQEPQQPGFLKSVGQEIIAPFKQIAKNQPKDIKGSLKEAGLIALLGPGFGKIAAAPKGEKLKTAGALGEIASYVTGVGAAKNVVAGGLKGLGKAIVKRAVPNAIEGAGFLGSGAVRRGETNPVKIGEQALVGAVTNVVANPLFSKLSEPISKGLLKGAARLYDSVLGVTKNEIKSGFKTAGEKIVEKGGFVAGSQNKIKDIADKAIDAAEEKAQTVLAHMDSAGVKVSTNKMVEPLNNMITQLKEIGEPIPARLQSIVDAIKSKGESLTATEANNLKRQYYDLMRNKKVNFNIPPEELAGAKQAWREAASGIRTAIADAANNIGKKVDDGVSPLSNEAGATSKLGDELNAINAEQGLHLDIRNKIEDMIASGELKNIKNAGDLAKILFGYAGGFRNIAAGVGFGAVTGNPLLGAAYLGANKVATSVPGRTIRASANIAASKATPTIMSLLEKLGLKATGEIKK